MKKIILIFLVGLIIVILGIPVLFFLFGIQSHPLVTTGKKLDYEAVARVKQLMRKNDPRKLRAGEVRNLTVTERDLNLFLDYALSRTPGDQKLYARVNLFQDYADVQFTLLLPQNPLGKFLNVATSIKPETDHVLVQRLKIGALRIPGWMANSVATLGHKFLLRYEQYRNLIELAHSIKNIQIANNAIAVIYQWQPEVIKKIRKQGRDLLLPKQERERLTVYYQKIAQLSQAMNGRNISLADFFRPLFELAQQRTRSDGDAPAENRALLLNLAAFSIGRNMNRIINLSDRTADLRMGKVTLTLLGRDDLAKHFLISAAISVSAGSGLANLAGIFKEMDDSRGGSGFSFADLAADRAGVKFAEIASQTSQQAVLLQQRMRSHIKEFDFMPRIDNLPEGIQQLEFKRRYKDLDSASYRMVEKEIERRIAACRIYRF